MLPVLNLEGGHRVCPLSSGLHKQWQHLVYLELGSLNLRPTLAPPPLPQLSNWPTGSTSVGSQNTNLRLSLMRNFGHFTVSWIS